MCSEPSRWKSELFTMICDGAVRAGEGASRNLSRSFTFTWAADRVRRFDERTYLASSDVLSIFASTVDPSVSAESDAPFLRIASVYRSIFRSDFPSILRRLLASSSTASSDLPSDCRTSLISSLFMAALLLCIIFSSRSFSNSFFSSATWKIYNIRQERPSVFVFSHIYLAWLQTFCDHCW